MFLYYIIMSLNSDKGFVVYRNFFNQDEQEQIKSYIIDQTVNYTSMTDFINNVFIKKVNTKLQWDAKYVKYRVSNNNNSADASAFHRDIFKWDENSTLLNVNNIYTCLTYLDPAIMELIPYSHNTRQLSIVDAIFNFSNAIRLDLNCGDVLVFNANLLHRGVFANVDLNTSRRLIQVFDVHPTKEQYELLAPRVYHIPASKQRVGMADLITKLSRHKLSGGFMNILGYLNAATGHGYTNDDDMKAFLVAHGLSSCIYLSSEGTRPRLQYKPNTFEESNVYILLDDTNDVIDVDPILYKAYEQNLWLCFSVFILIIIIICLGVRETYIYYRKSSWIKKIIQ